MFTDEEKLLIFRVLSHLYHETVTVVPDELMSKVLERIKYYSAE